MGEIDRNHALDHIVVLMFENRSFDTLLGNLYKPNDVPNFEGVAGKNFVNPVPPGVIKDAPVTVPLHIADNMDTPDPDPGEEYPHINTQLFGKFVPEENEFAEIDYMKPPFNCPPSTVVPSMSGFVADYISTFKAEIKRNPTYREYAQIMAFYTPDQVPVLSTVAKGFGVFDHWFCDVPSQTFSNRSFFHAASSSGLVNNLPYGKFSVKNDAPTIFERLEAKGIGWKVYFDPEQILPVTALIHASRIYPFFATHFCTMDDFYEDARNGKLPSYAFIEPNMLHPHTDMHPPLMGRLRMDLHLPRQNAILGGEHLLSQVYSAIKESSSEDGSNWSNTFFMITFDEHGGTFDHVPPPAAPSPSVNSFGEMGFKFDRLGLRVPTIAVSAWIKPGTVINEEFRHTSMIRTLREKWSLGGAITARDATAASIVPILTQDVPVTPDKWPSVAAPEITLGHEILSSLELPMSLLERELAAEALYFEGKLLSKEVAADPDTIRHGDTHEQMLRLRDTWFPHIGKKMVA